jgi:hypothetical protein
MQPAANQPDNDPLAAYSREWARNHLASGKRIFAIGRNSKQPAISREQGGRGFHDATDDPKQVEQWAAIYPGCNWAFVPGDHDLVVIDVDPRNGGTREGWPATYTVRTPSGGWHLYYSLSGGLKSGSHKFGKGIDIKSISGYALLPGSQINGREYTPEDPLAEYAPFPADRLEALNVAKHEPALSQAKGDPVSAEELVSVLRFLDPNAPRDVWRDEVAAIRATPGIEVEELRDIALRYSRGEYHGETPALYTDDAAVNQVFGTMPPREGGVGYGTLKAKARTMGWREDQRTSEAVFSAAIAKLPANNNTPSKQPPSRVDFYRGWPPSKGAARPPIVFLDPEKLLPLTDDGAVVLWYGLRSALKTTTAVCTLMAAIKRYIDDPQNAPTIRVAYGIGEGVHSFDTGQVPAAAKHFGIPLDVLDKYWRTTPVAPLTNDQEVEAYVSALATMFDGKPPTVLAIDTFATAAQGVDENGAEIGGLLLSTGPVGRIKERLGGPLVMILDHAGKEAGRGVRGHSSKEGNADAIGRFEFDKSTRRHVGIVEKMRGAEDGFEIEYRVTPPGQVPVVTPIGRLDARQAKARQQHTSLDRSALNCLSWFSEWNERKKCDISTADLATALMRSKAWTEPDAPGAAAPEIVLRAPFNEEEHASRKALQHDLARLARRWSKHPEYRDLVAKDATSPEWTFRAHAAARLQQARADEREGER